VKILLALTYYRPHISGLTIYVERLGQALAARGHTVSVLTSQYDPALPIEEVQAGVRIVRVPVVARVSKGVIMPTYGFVATRMVREHDLLSVHLPQFDATGLALRGRIMRKPVVLTYHCDLRLPPGLFNRLVERVVYGANYTAALLADRIVTSTQDYADNSRLLSRFKHKIVVIPPPVVMPEPVAADVAHFKETHALNGHSVIGFAARFAAEKGVEYLLEALPQLLTRFPHLKVLFAGPYRNVLGEEAYWERLSPKIARLGNHWTFLGTLPASEMPAFFAACDCLVVPSINSTEAFGMVQIESMLCGTPVVASDLPGVRQPVSTTGMGEIAPVADGAKLAEKVARVLEHKSAYVRPRQAIEDRYGIKQTIDSYEQLFESLYGEA